MPSKHKQIKTAESVISFCILFILSGVAAGVFVKQSHYCRRDFSVSLGEDLSVVMPVGFKIMDEMETYDAETLYEKINGKAELYLESGFKDLKCQRFVSQNNQELWIEIFLYDMGSARNAFSVYSTQKRPDGQTVSAFTLPHHYQTNNAFYFVCGGFYVEIIASVQSQELSNAARVIAVNIPTQLNIKEDRTIDEFELFADEALVAGSYKLFLKNAFGYNGLTDIFAAQYRVDNEAVTVFLSKRSDETEASAILKSYYTFMIKNGAEDIEDFDFLENSKAVDFYGSIEIIFSKGSFFGGIHQAENIVSARKAAIILSEKLTEANKK